MKVFKKVLKILGFITLIFVTVIYCLFYWATSPKSDKKVKSTFTELQVEATLTNETFRSFNYRKAAIIKDTTLPTLVFVHGTIGSLLDFSSYMTDSLLLSKANMISYDRVGYNYEDKNDVQESIAFERDLLEDLVKNITSKKVILVGYSYGGPIALASNKKFKKVILFAPAVYSKVEPMPWMVNLHKWKLTRWLVPPIWKQASKEKISHRQDLKNFENNWKENPNLITSIHGNSDWIVPYTNSEFLKSQFPQNQFELVTIQDAGHSLVWTEFNKIKQELLKHLN